MAKGFTVCTGKAALGGRTDQVVALAGTNLWR
jgi:hypothetical protein